MLTVKFKCLLIFTKNNSYKNLSHLGVALIFKIYRFYGIPLTHYSFTRAVRGLVDVLYMRIMTKDTIFRQNNWLVAVFWLMCLLYFKVCYTGCKWNQTCCFHNGFYLYVRPVEFKIFLWIWMRLLLHIFIRGKYLLAFNNYFYSS